MNKQVKLDVIINYNLLELNDAIAMPVNISNKFKVIKKLWIIQSFIMMRNVSERVIKINI
jgi:hypothetical protein